MELPNSKCALSNSPIQLTLIVLDTNVVVGYYLGRNPHSARARVFQLWRYERKLQLIISDEVEAEYFEVLERLGAAEKRVERFREVLQQRQTVTHVNLGALHHQP